VSNNLNYLRRSSDPPEWTQSRLARRLRLHKPYLEAMTREARDKEVEVDVVVMTGEVEILAEREEDVAQGEREEAIEEKVDGEV